MNRNSRAFLAMKVTFHSAFDNSAFNMFARQRTYKLNDWLIAECPPAALVSRGSSTSSLPACESVPTKEEVMNDRTEADKAWEARQEAARYRIFNAATDAVEATDQADDAIYFCSLGPSGQRCRSCCR